MFTVCPKCALTLVVTAADLRVAQGYVRCGRCSSVFNALAQLSDERQAAAAGATAAASPPAAASAPTASSAS
ncbi:MAG: MJ0042-type zinc finger domain-containing protein, partial [Steroidobacteraceae bacterium]